MSRGKFEFWDGQRWSTVEENSVVLMDMNVVIACGATLQLISDISGSKLDPRHKLVTTIRHKPTIQLMHRMWYSSL